MRPKWRLPPDGDQLRLDLFKGVPWDGRRPRGLTRVQIELSLRQEPPRHEVYMDPAQLEVWPGSVRPSRRKKAPTGSVGGARSLLPLKKGRRSRPFACGSRKED